MYLQTYLLCPASSECDAWHCISCRSNVKIPLTQMFRSTLLHVLRVAVDNNLFLICQSSIWFTTVNLKIYFLLKYNIFCSPISIVVHYSYMKWLMFCLLSQYPMRIQAFFWAVCESFADVTRIICNHLSGAPATDFYFPLIILIGLVILMTRVVV